jgi:hypothetical protein
VNLQDHKLKTILLQLADLTSNHPAAQLQFFP